MENENKAENKAENPAGEENLKDSFEKIQAQYSEQNGGAIDFCRKMEMETIECRPGHAVLEICLKSWHMNILGIVHGGVLYSLADTAGGVAAMTGRDYAVPTIDGTIHYLKAGKDTSKIIARAEEIRCGRAYSVCECKIYDERETLLATATMTYYHLRKK